MKKYIISGIIGFLIHVAWIIGGTVLLDYESPLNIAKFYGETFDKQSFFTAFVYALLISIIFAGIVRVILIKITKYNSKEKWLLSLSSGIGFIAAFLGLIYVLWRMFANFSF